MRIALAFVLAASACWSGTATPTAPVVVSPPPQHAPDPPKYSVWEGHYVCSQGPTGVRLLVSAKPDNSARVRFDFSALPENPSVPSGSYTLVGTLRVALDGALDLTVVPHEWLTRPQGYDMVGLRAQSDAAQRTLRGRITHDNCGELELTRLR